MSNTELNPDNVVSLIDRIKHLPYALYAKGHLQGRFETYDKIMNFIDTYNIKEYEIGVN